MPCMWVHQMTQFWGCICNRWESSAHWRVIIWCVLQNSVKMEKWQIIPLLRYSDNEGSGKFLCLFVFVLFCSVHLLIGCQGDTRNSSGKKSTRKDDCFQQCCANREEKQAKDRTLGYISYRLMRLRLPFFTKYPEGSSSEVDPKLVGWSSCDALWTKFPSDLDCR